MGVIATLGCKRLHAMGREGRQCAPLSCVLNVAESVLKKRASFGRSIWRSFHCRRVRAVAEERWRDKQRGPSGASDSHESKHVRI